MNKRHSIQLEHNVYDCMSVYVYAVCILSTNKPHAMNMQSEKHIIRKLQYDSRKVSQANIQLQEK